MKYDIEELNGVMSTGYYKEQGSQLNYEDAQLIDVTDEDLTDITFDILNQESINNIIIPEWAEEVYDKGNQHDLLIDALKNNDGRDLITREHYAELVVKLYEALTKEIVDVGNEQPFLDTSNPEIIKAYKLGIVNGTGNGLFEPDKNIIRQELAVMYYRLIKLINPNADYNPDDVEVFRDDSSIAEWAKEAAYLNRAYQIIKGTGDNSFEPIKEAMFAEAITIAVRVYESDLFANIKDTSLSSGIIIDTDYGKLEFEGAYYVEQYVLSDLLFWKASEGHRLLYIRYNSTDDMPVEPKLVNYELYDHEGNLCDNSLFRLHHDEKKDGGMFYEVPDDIEYFEMIWNDNQKVVFGNEESPILFYHDLNDIF